MKFFAIAALFMATAIAVPTGSSCPSRPGNGGGNGGSNPGNGGSNPGNGGSNPGNGGNGGNHNGLCPSGGLYTNPQCCAVSVLGVADVDCATPSQMPDANNSFQAICAKDGKQAQCCVLPLAGQGLLCTNAVGSN